MKAIKFCYLLLLIHPLFLNCIKNENKKNSQSKEETSEKKIPFTIKVDPLTGNPVSKEKTSPSQWTWMIYLREENTNIKADYEIAQLENNGSIEGEINYLLLYDAYDDKKDGVYYLEKKVLPSKEMISKIDFHCEEECRQLFNNNLDLTNWQTLQNFMLWSKKQYPAERYGLIIRSHGNGIFYPEDMANKSSRKKSRSFSGGITFWDLNKALKNFKNIDGKNLDFIVFHACLLAHLEAAYQMKDYVEYFIASEDLLPQPGLNYQDIFKELNNDLAMKSEKLALLFINQTVKFYEQLKKINFSVTLSAVHIPTLIAETMPAFEDFIKTISLNFNLYETEIRKNRNITWSDRSNPNNKDLGCFISLIKKDPKLPSTLRGKAEILFKKLEKAIVANGFNKEENFGITGLKIWFPDGLNYEKNRSYYLESDLFLFNETNWGNWLNIFDNSHKDKYEPDNNQQEATLLSKGIPQVHSLIPVPEIDYFKIIITSPKKIYVETSGLDFKTADTVISLYQKNSKLAENNNTIHYENQNKNFFHIRHSSLEYEVLNPGTYYVKVEPFKGYPEIPVITDYQIVYYTQKPAILALPDEIILPTSKSKVILNINNKGEAPLIWDFKVNILEMTNLSLTPKSNQLLIEYESCEPNKTSWLFIAAPGAWNSPQRIKLKYK